MQHGAKTEDKRRIANEKDTPQSQNSIQNKKPNLLYFLSLNGVFSILVNFYPYSVIFLSYYFGVISILQLIILVFFIS